MGGGGRGAAAAARPAAGAGGRQRGARQAERARQRGPRRALVQQREPAAGTGVAAGARPSAGQVNNFLDVPRPPPALSGRWRGWPGAGGAAADFLQGGGGAAASQLPAGSRAAAAAAPPDPALLPVRPSLAVRQARAPENLSENRAGRVENRQELQGNRQQRRDEVRNQVAENHPRMDFWSNNPGWAAWRIIGAYRWATWGALGGWIGYGAGEPSSYAYGENIYYEGDQVYYGDQPVATAEQYAEQADAIAAAAPATKPESSEWLPLGVFALTQDGQASGVEPTLFMQLAISKEGVIAGTFKNMATDQVQTLEGMADKKSQRVAWSVAGQKRPIMETGISNLTQDSSPALIHFADGQTQQWLLVRLPEPKQGETCHAPTRPYLAEYVVLGDHLSRDGHGDLRCRAVVGRQEDVILEKPEGAFFASRTSTSYHTWLSCRARSITLPER